MILSLAIISLKVILMPLLFVIDRHEIAEQASLPEQKDFSSHASEVTMAGCESVILKTAAGGVKNMLTQRVILTRKSKSFPFKKNPKYHNI